MLAIGKTIDREIALVSRFLALLLDEQEALKTANPDALPKIHDEKYILVDQLNALEIERSSLTALGGPASSARERMESWMAEHPAEKQIAARWQQLIQLCQDAKQQNILNARLVNLHLEQTNQALAILTRDTNESVLYGSNGQAAQYMGRRIVDSA
jgi:flagellar biosynthesis/type III secretory pathway chaperone